MDVNFCRRCGKTVRQTGLGIYECPSGHRLFYKSYPAALIVLLNNQDEVLIATRAFDPGKGSLDLPGGFVDAHETLEQAAIRELQEETGLQRADVTKLEYLCSAVDAYDYQAETQSVIVTAFLARTTKAVKVKPQDDVARLAWASIMEVDFTQIHPDFNCVRNALRLMQQRFAKG